MSIIQKLKDATIPSLYASAASVGLYYVLIDKDISSKVPFMNQTIPVWAAVAGSSFIGGEIGSLLTEYVGPKIPMLQEGGEIIIPPAMAGISTWLAMRTLISENTEFKNAFLIGAGGNFIGDTIYARM